MLLRKQFVSTDVIEFLHKDIDTNRNIIHYLNYDPNAIVHTFDNDINNGTVISNFAMDYFFVALKNQKQLEIFFNSLPKGFKVFSAVPEQIATPFIKNLDLNFYDLVKIYALKDKKAFDEFYKDQKNNCPYIVEKLTLADAIEVNNYYTYKTEDDSSLTELKESIAKRDTACIRINNELAGWCLVHAEQAIGPLYIKQNYRGLGLAKIISAKLIDNLFNKGITPYLHIVDNNNKSLSLIEAIDGMKYTHSGIWFGLYKK